MLQSCKTDVAIWTPIFLTNNEGIIIKNLVDLILPKTEATPGALELNVPEFLDQYVAKVYSDEKQKHFKDGIRAVIEKLDISNNKVSKLKAEDYDGLLAKYLKASKAALVEFNNNEEDTLVLNALTGLRSSAIWAYKTSEQIGENILAYDPIPGVQKGCISVEEATGGKAWSLA